MVVDITDDCEEPEDTGLEKPELLDSESIEITEDWEELEDTELERLELLESVWIVEPMDVETVELRTADVVERTLEVDTEEVAELRRVLYVEEIVERDVDKTPVLLIFDDVDLRLLCVLDGVENWDDDSLEDVLLTVVPEVDVWGIELLEVTNLLELGEVTNARAGVA